MTDLAEREAARSTEPTPAVKIDRRLIDKVLIGAGAVVAVGLVIAGALLSWGASFSDDYVFNELGSQNIILPSVDAINNDAGLSDQAKAMLLPFAGEQMTTGKQAEAYAGYINGHLGRYGGTYAELGATERAARAAVAEAVEAGESEGTVAELRAASAQVTADRDTVFKGETLRGLLLSAYAWSTVGEIAGISAVVAFIAAALLGLLVLAGAVHLVRYRKH
jgi:hypothetical protein